MTCSLHLNAAPRSEGSHIASLACASFCWCFKIRNKHFPQPFQGLNVHTEMTGVIWCDSKVTVLIQEEVSMCTYSERENYSNADFCLKLPWNL